MLAPLPLEIGSIYVLLCKGAASLMLLEGVCKGFVGNNETSEENFNLGEDNPELDSRLSMQAHLAGKEYCVCNIDSRAFPCYSHHRFYSPDLN